jgi:hypothetical protein
MAEGGPWAVTVGPGGRVRPGDPPSRGRHAGCSSVAGSPRHRGPGPRQPSAKRRSSRQGVRSVCGGPSGLGAAVGRWLLSHRRPAVCRRAVAAVVAPWWSLLRLWSWRGRCRCQRVVVSVVSVVRSLSARWVASARPGRTDDRPTPRNGLSWIRPPPAGHVDVLPLGTIPNRDTIIIP